MALLVVACDGAGGVSVGTGLDAAIPEQPASFRIGVSGGFSQPSLSPAAAPTAVEIDAATTVAQSFRFDLVPPYDCADYAALLTTVADDWRAAVCEADEAGASLRFQGPFVFDLTRETVTPDTSRLVLPAGTYSRVRLKLEADAGGEQDGASVFVVGRLIDGGIDPFVLALDLEDELEYRSAVPVTVDARGAAIVVRLDLSAWLLGAGDAIADCRDELVAEQGAGVPLVFDARQDDGAECDAVEELLEGRLDAVGEVEDESSHEDEHGDVPERDAND
ncbi:MAG: hypothetical protein D6761_04075 [Candidatus Dadabacteria bacterium]|nr:MAG: hypothetical protein D6761_04075 [Candidatus Dadabacteria bacterium]